MAEIAKRAGVAPQAIYQYVSGKTVPRIDTAERLVRACGKELWEILRPKDRLSEADALWSALNIVRDAFSALERGETPPGLDRDYLMKRLEALEKAKGRAK